ncbi:Alpha/beta-Hydrolases superfamily protein [Melia azedarach]|uniref:Alpha/beta-Hydrolases superfamily protein n=1 Tax=Melia azedarach TaxID=155640 RepID=A0ACC1XY13_MELAZ|nr:Alpha/beta-Hydrolases superfamily protein [Melia azedarach]
MGEVHQLVLTTVAHDVAIQSDTTGFADLKIERLHLLIVHPFFAGNDREMYKFMRPGSSGCDDEPGSGSEVERDGWRSSAGRSLLSYSGSI